MLTVHAGVLVLIFLILSMLILTCRRRRRAKATSRVTVPNFSGQPQPYPSWQGQQPVQTPYGPGVGWHYPAQGTARAKSTELGQAPRTAPSEQAPSTAPGPFGTSSSGQVQRPPPASQVQSIALEGLTQSTAPSVSAQHQAAAHTPTPPRRAPNGTPSAGAANDMIKVHPHTIR
jgi:hypothetical protein